MDDSPKPVFYKEIDLHPKSDDPRQLVFVAPKGAPKPPEELLLLRQEYERTARVAAVLFEDNLELRKSVFALLHQAADRGFRGDSWNIEDGKANLDEVRQNIVDSGHIVRSKFLRKYTILMLLFGIVPLFVGLAVFLTAGFGRFDMPSAGQPYSPVFAWTVATFWIPAGAAICVWAEFALRMQEGLTYENLLGLDPSRWRPSERVLITTGIAFIFAFLLAFEVVQVGLGSILLNDFAKKTPAMALAVGGITGLTFVTVRDLIFRTKPIVK